MMRELRLLGLFVVVSALGCFSQSLNDPLSQGTTPQGTPVDCSDPSMANLPQCTVGQGQTSNQGQGGDNSSPTRIPTLANPVGSNPDQYTPSPPPPNPSQLARPQITRPETEFEQMVADSVG